MYSVKHDSVKKKCEMINLGWSCNIDSTFSQKRNIATRYNNLSMFRVVNIALG